MALPWSLAVSNSCASSCITSSMSSSESTGWPSSAWQRTRSSVAAGVVIAWAGAGLFFIMLTKVARRSEDVFPAAGILLRAVQGSKFKKFKVGGAREVGEGSEGGRVHAKAQRGI